VADLDDDPVTDEEIEAHVTGQPRSVHLWDRWGTFPVEAARLFDALDALPEGSEVRRLLPAAEEALVRWQAEEAEIGYLQGFHGAVPSVTAEGLELHDFEWPADTPERLGTRHVQWGSIIEDQAGDLARGEYDPGMGRAAYYVAKAEGLEAAAKALRGAADLLDGRVKDIWAVAARFVEREIEEREAEEMEDPDEGWERPWSCPEDGEPDRGG
jgi:hypothetical protein